MSFSYLLFLLFHSIVATLVLDDAEWVGGDLPAILGGGELLSNSQAYIKMITS